MSAQAITVWIAREILAGEPSYTVVFLRKPNRFREGTSLWWQSMDERMRIRDHCGLKPGQIKKATVTISLE